MAHFKTADNGQSHCEEFGEFDVFVDGRTVAVGPQPDDYCSACGEVQPTWTILTDEEFLKRWPL